MYELALVTVRATARRSLVPLLAVFSFIVFVRARRFCAQLVVSVRVAALVTEFAKAGCHKIAAQLRFIIYAEVFDVLEHLLPRGKIHGFLLPLRRRREAQALLHLKLAQ